eukprot:PhF_6_TR921/c0_g1_i1/m.1556
MGFTHLSTIRDSTSIIISCWPPSPQGNLDGVLAQCGALRCHDYPMVGEIQSTTPSVDNHLQGHHPRLPCRHVVPGNITCDSGVGFVDVSMCRNRSYILTG